MYQVIEIIEPEEKENICRDILADLPEWFGIPEANQEYARGVRDKRLWTVLIENKTAAFISLIDHNRFTSEIFVIGVYKKLRNKGCGTALLQFIEKILLIEKKKFLSVKTLAATHPSPEYSETREFYLAKGFLPLEIFPELWGKENPCLLMVKILKLEMYK